MGRRQRWSQQGKSQECVRRSKLDAEDRASGTVNDIYHILGERKATM